MLNLHLLAIIIARQPTLLRSPPCLFFQPVNSQYYSIALTLYHLRNPKLSLSTNLIYCLTRFSVYKHDTIPVGVFLVVYLSSKSEGSHFSNNCLDSILNSSFFNMAEQSLKVDARERLEEEYKVWKQYHPKVKKHAYLYIMLFRS